MDLSNLHKELTLALKQRNISIILFVVSLMINLLISVSLFKQDSQTILVPIGLEAEVGISRQKLSNSYLIEVSNLFLSHLLDLSPSNIGYKKSLLLKYVSPDHWRQFNEYFESQEVKYKEYNLSTSFTPVELIVDPDALRVEAKGILKSIFAKSGGDEKEATYVISYKYKNAILQLKEFYFKEEIDSSKDAVLRAENKRDEGK